MEAEAGRRENIILLVSERSVCMVDDVVAYPFSVITNADPMYVSDNSLLLVMNNVFVRASVLSEMISAGGCYR